MRPWTHNNYARSLAAAVALGAAFGCDGKTGESGASALIETTAVDSAPGCTGAAVRIDLGRDGGAAAHAGNGKLDDDEITQTQYACNGAEGASAAVTPVSAGTECEHGGVMVAVGASAPTYVCTGADGADGASAALTTETPSTSGASRSRRSTAPPQPQPASPANRDSGNCRTAGGTS